MEQFTARHLAPLWANQQETAANPSKHSKAWQVHWEPGSSADSPRKYHTPLCYTSQWAPVCVRVCSKLLTVGKRFPHSSLLGTAKHTFPFLVPPYVYSECQDWLKLCSLSEPSLLYVRRWKAFLQRADHGRWSGDGVEELTTLTFCRPTSCPCVSSCISWFCVWSVSGPALAQASHTLLSCRVRHLSCPLLQFSIKWILLSFLFPMKFIKYLVC